MSLTITPEDQNYLNELLNHYETKRAALLPVLTFLQNKTQWITPEVEKFAAEFLDLPIIKVREVVSFYTMYYQKPIGKYHFQVCRTLSCALNGAENLMQDLQNLLGIGFGEVSADGLFSLEHVECLAACDKAPTVRINNKYYHQQTKESLSALVQQWRNEK